jgi:hypothetical protein
MLAQYLRVLEDDPRLERGSTGRPGMGAEARQLDGFTSYGTSSPLPDAFEGGLASLEIAIHLAGISQTFFGSLQIHCAINKPGTLEGVTSSVPTFNEKFTVPIFGETLFINQD